MARPVPVLPDVGSTMVPPGLSLPSRSAAPMRAIATRSLIDPPGFSASTLATICGVSPAARRDSRTSGVVPIASRIESLMSTMGPVVVALIGVVWHLCDTFRDWPKILRCAAVAPPILRVDLPE
jgi:hypothetical protein